MGECGLFIYKWERMPKVCCKCECQNCSELSLPPQQQQVLCAAFWHLLSYSQIFLSKGFSHLLSCLSQKCSGAGWKQSPVVLGFVQTKPLRQPLPCWFYLAIVLLKCSSKWDAILAINKRRKFCFLTCVCLSDRFRASKYKWSYIFLCVKD